MKKYSRVLELIIFALALPVAGLWLFGHDPIGLHAGFPWAMVPPIVFAARYGTLWGGGCALLALTALAPAAPAYADRPLMLVVAGIGLAVMTILVGDMTTAWRRRCLQAEADRHYLQQRLNAFANDYHVLKVSHGHLEEHLAGQRLSLRQALQRLKSAMNGRRLDALAGEELMTLLAQFCAIHVAGLYTMKSASVINPEPVATHGAMDALPIFDPLLKHALRERKLVSVSPDFLAGNAPQHSSLLAVVPVIDSQEKLHGLLVISDMHFMAFQQENLNLLALLGVQIGNLLSRSSWASGPESAYGQLATGLDDAIRFARANAAQSVLLKFAFKPVEQREAVIAFIIDQLRSLDSHWKPDADDNAGMLAILLPLVSPAQAELYVQRIAGAINERFSLHLPDLLSSHRSLTIDRKIDRHTCERFLQSVSPGDFTTDMPDEQRRHG